MEQNNYEKCFTQLLLETRINCTEQKNASNGNEILTKCFGFDCEPTIKFKGHFMHLVNQEKSIKLLVLVQRNTSSG